MPQASSLTGFTIVVSRGHRIAQSNHGRAMRGACKQERRPSKVAVLLVLERVMGIEPTLAAWEAAVLPLNYTRFGHDSRT